MNSGKLSDRERAILEHLGRHRLSFQEIIGELFFDGGNPQKALDELRRKELLRVEKGFGGNRSSYQLTPKGAKLAGVPARRADTLAADAMATHLAILSFCFLKNRPRLRLFDAEIKELLGVAALRGYHCIENSRKCKRVYHVYVPGDATPPDEIVRRTREHVAAAIRIPELESWLANRVYSHAVLVEQSHRRATVLAALDDAEYEGGRPLRQVAHIHVECVPGPATLQEALDVLA